MIGRPELCFWRMFAVFAVLVCVANIITLLGGNYKMKEVPLELAHQPERVPYVNFNGSSVMMNMPVPTNTKGEIKPFDLTKVSVKNPLWLSVKNLDKFFLPKKVLMLGKKRKKKSYVVIGVPTVHRSKAYYLVDTVKWLVSNLPLEDRDKVVIVVFVADFDIKYRNKVVNDMKAKFPSSVNEGLIQVIQSQQEYYPNLDNLPLLYGDKASRVKWRSKQSLDYSYMYYYCADLAEYYIQLEDDVLAAKDYFRKIKGFIDSKQHENWSTIEFGARGFIGMTYRTKYLHSLARFSRFYFWTMPIDWIFRVYNDIFLFGNDKKNVHKPPVFKHIGEYSSLTGQLRKLEDIEKKQKKDVITHIYQPKNGNPPATITTSILDYVHGHEIDKAYSDEGYFWGKKIKRGLYIEIVLAKPVVLSRIVIPSGSPLYPSDSLLDTSLSISSEPYEGQCVRMYEVGKFKNTPVVDYTFNITKGIYCVRLTIEKARMDDHGRSRWLIIREIALL